MLPLLLILPLLVAEQAQAAYLPFRRSAMAKPEPAVDAIQRAGTRAFENAQLNNRRGGGSVIPPEQRRLVRRRNKGDKRSDCGGSSANSTSTADESSSTTTGASSESTGSSVIGSEAWAHSGQSGQSNSNSESSWSGSSTDTYAGSSVKPTGTSSGNTPQSTSTWQLIDKIAGSNFFDSQYWNFWSYDDPTHGDVQYVDSSTAWADGLVSIDSNNRAIMKVETTQQVSGNRKSVRIHNNRVWTGGMVLMDAEHMPTGCGTWPAWWQNGPNWPNGGEIDILEGVNDGTTNQISLHTGPGCQMPSNLNDGMKGTLTTGNWDSYNCGSAATSNQGCGVMQPSGDNSYGPGFNEIGGGVYALVWVKTGISVWFHPRTNIPADITSGSPNPDAWGKADAYFPSDNCNMYEFFYDQFNIFDTTLCGDWAGNAWSASCAASTGYGSCTDYVRNEGSKLTEAYWAVNSVTYYNSTSLV